MTSIVDFTSKEQAQTVDLVNIGVYARAADQGIVGAAVAYPHHWSRFTIAQPTAITLDINPGLLFVDDVMYESSEIITINLQVYLPLVTGDEKWVALLVRGTHVVETANRMVKVYTDVDTAQLVQQSIPKTDRLKVEIVVQDGIAAPPPALHPSIAGDACCLAFVRLTTSGVAEIEPGENWRLKSLYEVYGQVTLLEGDMTDIRQRTAQLETDIAFLAGQMRSIPRPEIIEQMKRNLAQLNRKLDLPEESRAYWYDPGLVLDQWDPTHADWLCRVNEGVRFQYAQIVDSQMAMLDPGNTDMKTTNNLLLPHWGEVVRLSVEGNDGYKDISQIVHTITTAVQNTVSGTSISYGPTVTVCENVNEWSTVGKVHPGETFNVNGTEYVSAGLTKNNNIAAGHLTSPVQWNADPQSEGHKNYDVQQKTVSTWSRTYTSYITKTYGVNGSVYAQSFLNSQQMILTSIELFFTRLGTDGDIHLFLCEIGEDGAPQFNNVIAQKTLTFANLALGWTKFSLTPTLLEAGMRYAWYTVTVGNHAIAFVNNNKFAQGSMFWRTDGAWAQGNPTEDFAFRLNAAQFTRVRTVVDFAPLTCPAGMTQLQLLYNGWAPPGTSLTWEIKPVGMTEWQLLNPTPDVNDNPLMGLPALAQLRATFIGTTDLQPAILMDVTARSAAMRMRTDAKFVSDVIEFGVSTTEVVVQTIVDAFDPIHNTFLNKIMVGSTTYSPDVTSVTIDDTKPTRRSIRSVFTVPATTSVRYRAEGTTDNVLVQYFLQNVLVAAI